MSASIVPPNMEISTRLRPFRSRRSSTRNTEAGWENRTPQCPIHFNQNPRQNFRIFSSVLFNGKLRRWVFLPFCRLCEGLFVDLAYELRMFFHHPKITKFIRISRYVSRYIDLRTGSYRLDRSGSRIAKKISIWTSDRIASHREIAMRIVAISRLQLCRSKSAVSFRPEAES